MVDRIDLIVAAANEGCLADLRGLAVCAYPGKSIDERIFLLAGFILQYEPMWQEVSKADAFQQRNERQPLYLDEGHQKNPCLTALDYLSTLKDFMRIWAARKHQGSPKANWEKMQKEFAALLLDTHTPHYFY